MPVRPDSRFRYVPGQPTDERFRAALAASLDAIFLCEAIRDHAGTLVDFDLVEVNQRAAEIFMLPREAMLGRTLRALLPTAERKGFLDRCIRVVETGESFEETLDVRSVGLKAEWVHHQIVRVGDGMLITSRDVSEQKRGEEALRRSEERYRELVERASDGIYRIDSYGVFTFANPIVSRILGLGVESVVGRHYLEFVRRDYHDQGIALYKRQIKELIPVTYWEFPAVTADGREVWIGQKVHTETDGRWVTGLFAVARDITERKRAELALRESEERYRFLAEQSADMLSRHAPDGTFRYASRAAQALLGYNPDELAGRAVAVLAHPDDVAAVRTAHARALGHLGVETVTFRARRRDGTYTWLETTSHAVRDPERGEVMEVLMVSRDVTERQGREERSRRAGVLEAVARVVGNLADELDAMVLPLRGAIDALRRQRSGPGEAEPAMRAWQQVNALHDLSRRLRAVGRRERLTPEVVDVNEIVRALEPAILRIAGDAVSVRFALDPWLPPAFADVGHVEAAVLELARNACAAMPLGGTLAVETFARGGDGLGETRGVAIRLRDSGDGIPVEVRQRLFEAYPLGASGDGAGLGLAAVHGMLAQAGGEITLEPAPGGGTLATIYLPDR